MFLKECDGKPKINYVTVFERPGLHEFLEKLSEFADLVLFTAGLEGLLSYISVLLCSILKLMLKYIILTVEIHAFCLQDMRDRLWIG